MQPMNAGFNARPLFRFLPFFFPLYACECINLADRFILWRIELPLSLSLDNTSKTPLKAMRFEFRLLLLPYILFGLSYHVRVSFRATESIVQSIRSPARHVTRTTAPGS